MIYFILVLIVASIIINDINFRIITKNQGLIVDKLDELIKDKNDKEYGKIRHK